MPRTERTFRLDAKQKSINLLEEMADKVSTTRKY